MGYRQYYTFTGFSYKITPVYYNLDCIRFCNNNAVVIKLIAEMWETSLRRSQMGQGTSDLMIRQI